MTIELAEYTKRLVEERDAALTSICRYPSSRDENAAKAEAFNASLYLLYLWTDGEYGEDAAGQPQPWDGPEIGSEDWHLLRHDKGQHHECPHAECVEHIRQEIHSPAHINRDGKFYGPDKCDWDVCIDYREMHAVSG